MNKIITQILENHSIRPDKLNHFQNRIIQTFTNNNLLVTKQLEEANKDIQSAFTELIKNCSISEFLLYFANGAFKEFQISYCLYYNMLDINNTNNDRPLLKDGQLDIVLLEQHIEKYCPLTFALGAFAHYNSEFLVVQNNQYTKYFYSLNKYAGLNEIFLESFFEPPFQHFKEKLFDLIHAILNDNFIVLKDLFADEISTWANINDINSFEDLNISIYNDPEPFLTFLNDQFQHFNKLRKCTLSLLETDLQPIPLHGSLQNGPDPLNNVALNTFNDHLKGLLSNSNITLDKRVRQGISKYLETDYLTENKTGGFVDVIKRQTILLQQHSNGQNPFNYNVIDENSLMAAMAHYQINGEDLRTINRLNYILSNRDLLNPSELKLLSTKISTLLGTISANYISDIFELYFFTVLKKNNVKIELLESQTKGGQEMSTCDYKIGNIMTADAKFLNGYKIEFKHISDHLNKVSTQIKNSISWHDIQYGGAVIGVRDKQFTSFEALRNFCGKDKNNLAERIPIVNLVIELYSEFRRHTIKNPEQIKFIIFYYIPELPKPTPEAQDRTPNGIVTISGKPQQEIMFILTTKYASESELENIKNTFGPISAFLFKFNNNFILENN